LTPTFCGSCSACLPHTFQSIDQPKSEKRKRTHPPLQLMRFRLDGSRTVEPAPTYETLIRHAERYGVEEVHETGVEAGLKLADLAGLKTDLREIAFDKRSRFGTKTKTAATNDLDALALYEAGLTPEEIASRLKWSLNRVRKAIQRRARHNEHAS
jgi:hypothetical protein